MQLAGLADHVDLDGALLLARDPFAGVSVDGDRLTASDAPGLGVEPVGPSDAPELGVAPRSTGTRSG